MGIALITTDGSLQTRKAEVGETGEVYKEDDSEKYEGSEILPQVWAYYHMNPSSVSMDQIETLAFTSDDKVIYAYYLS